MGGTSSEREVSLQSGRNVAEALASLGKYEVVPVVIDADNLDAMHFLLKLTRDGIKCLRWEVMK